MPPPLLEIRNATKIYTTSGKQVAALQNVNLEIAERPATITTIAGESGSGKTTLANAVLDFVRLSSGQIIYKGNDIATLNKHQQLDYRRQVQAIFQDPYGVYNPFYSVNHVFDMVIRRFKLARSKKESRQLVEDALNRVGMRGDEVLEKHPHQLSGGQRQRMMIARAYLLRSSLIVADEPVSMVDASLRAMILDIMLGMKNEQNISFLYITHDLSTAYQIGDEICILHKGSIVEQGTAQDVIDNPQHDYSKLLIGSIPVPDPNVKWDTKVVLPTDE